MNIKDMLEKEITTSNDFSKKNFGLKVGDEFREIAQEIVKSDKVSVRLTVNLLKAALEGKSFADSLHPDKSPADVILENLGAFEGQLEFFYWGIQIGRRLEREEENALKNIGL